MLADEDGRLVFEDQQGGYTTYNVSDPYDGCCEDCTEENDDDGAVSIDSNDSEQVATFIQKTLKKRKKNPNACGFSSDSQKSLFIPGHTGKCAQIVEIAT